MYKIIIIEQNNQKIGEIIADDVILSTEQDALDIMSDVRFYGSDCILIQDYQLPAAFFDLSTKLAGVILQKFTQYHMRLAIVGDFSKYPSKNLSRFIHESNKGSQIFFCAKREEAINKFL